MLRIEELHTPLARPALAVWERGRLLVADAAGGCWIDGRIQSPLGATPQRVALSLSGTHAAAAVDGSARVVVWRTDAAASAHIDLGDSGPACGLCFARRDDEDVLAVATRHALTLHALDGRALAVQPLRGLAAASLHGIADGALAVLGQEFGESRDTLALFGAAEIPVPAATLGERFRFRAGLVDSAVRLAIGPAERGRAVVFRDPDDAEEPLEEDDAQAIVPREWCRRGFYIATLDGVTQQRIESELVLASGAPLCASATRIAAALGGDRIAMLSREGGEILYLDLHWRSASRSGDRVLASAPDGALRLIHLDA